MNKFSVALIAASLACGGSAVLANNDATHGKDMAKKIDTNNDGMVSRDEYMRYYESKWQKLNKNSSGMVSTTELEKMHTDKMRGDDKDKNKSSNY